MDGSERIVDQGRENRHVAACRVPDTNPESVLLELGAQHSAGQTKRNLLTLSAGLAHSSYRTGPLPT